MLGPLMLTRRMSVLSLVKELRSTFQGKLTLMITFPVYSCRSFDAYYSHGERQWAVKARCFGAGNSNQALEEPLQLK